MANDKLGKWLQVLAITMVLFAALTMSTGGAQAASFKVTQTGADVEGWFVGNDPDPNNNPALTATFEAGTASVGSGSLEVSLSGPAEQYNKFLITRDDYAGHRLDEFTTFSYDTYYDSVSTGTSATWYVNLYIDTDADGTRDLRLDFAPHGIVEDDWQTWDLLTNANWRYQTPSGPGHTWADILATYPDAIVAETPFPAAPDYPSLVFNIGDSRNNYRDITTNIDNIRIGLNGSADDWDFDPPSVACVIPNCSFESPAGADQYPDSWKRAGVKVPTDGTDTAQFFDGAQSFRFVNAKARGKRLYQNIAISGLAGDQLDLTFSWRAEDVAGRKGKFRVIATLYYTRGGRSNFYVNMPTGTTDIWETYSLPFTAKKDYKKLRVLIEFSKQGSAWFDNFGLTVN